MIMQVMKLRPGAEDAMLAFAFSQLLSCVSGNWRLVCTVFWRLTPFLGTGLGPKVSVSIGKRDLRLCCWLDINHLKYLGCMESVYCPTPALGWDVQTFVPGPKVTLPNLRPDSNRRGQRSHFNQAGGRIASFHPLQFGAISFTSATFFYNTWRWAALDNLLFGLEHGGDVISLVPLLTLLPFSKQSRGP